MFDDTLVVCGGSLVEPYTHRSKLTKDNHGRDHHGRCFTNGYCFAKIKGFDYGQTDDYSYNIVKDPSSIRDLNATILDRMGIDRQEKTNV